MADPQQMARRRRRFIAGAAAAGLLLCLPEIGIVKDNTFLFSRALIWGLVGLSINVLTGYAGQMSLAQAALMGSGAFTLGILYSLHGVPFWVAYPIAGLVTSAVTVLIGIPALRIRGLHLAIVTLGFQFVMARVVFRQDVITSGAAGIDIEMPMWIGGRRLTEQTFMYVIAVTLLVIWMADRNLASTRGGRAFYAIREDEQVAASFGISVQRYKLLAFAIAGFYAGLAGALFSTLLRSAGAELFDYDRSLELLVYGVIGGLGSRAGVFISTMFPIFFTQIFTNLQTWSIVLGGFLLILTLTRYRGGLAEQGRELAHLATHLWKHRRHVALGLLRLPASVARAVSSLPSAAAAAGGWARLPRALRERRHARAEHQAQAAEEHDPEAAQVLATTSVGQAAVSGSVLRRNALGRSARGPLLEVREVSIRFGGVQALDGVTLEVREGEIVGLMGPNGAGKTTLFNCVSGFAKPNSGQVWFGGRDVTSTPAYRRACMGFGRTFQNIGLVKSETVLANLMIAQHSVAGYGPLEGILRTQAVRRSEDELRERAEEALTRLGLLELAGRVVHDLPHGLLKVVELGAALVTGPRILLLDEPSSGMAPPEAEQLGRTLKEIQAAFDVTVLMIEHHVPLVLSVADYVYVLNFGELLAEGEPSAIARHPEVIAAYLGSDEGDLGGEEALVSAAAQPSV
ncbi:MAG TPA: branched-chain amino acid ABC transporter ATP-binding protein/permease [Actinomycetota bacterium]|nr:branched-chain amino acid ABC transporter ATP-binding protein/permease [Actinomycetota bacterium]